MKKIKRKKRLPLTSTRKAKKVAKRLVVKAFEQGDKQTRNGIKLTLKDTIGTADDMIKSSQSSMKKRQLQSCRKIYKDALDMIP